MYKHIWHIYVHKEWPSNGRSWSDPYDAAGNGRAGRATIVGLGDAQIAAGGNPSLSPICVRLGRRINATPAGREPTGATRHDRTIREKCPATFEYNVSPSFSICFHVDDIVILICYIDNCIRFQRVGLPFLPLTHVASEWPFLLRICSLQRFTSSSWLNTAMCNILTMVFLQ